MARRTLPTFIEPMAAKLGKPFDSDEFLYEIKWDGFRGVCYVDSTLRIVGRRGTNFTADFPELNVIANLPPGAIIDGEIVLFSEGRPNFHKLLKKQNRAAVSFVAFDLLYDRFESVMKLPCETRRDRLRKLLKKVDEPNLLMSEGVVGQGIAYYQQAIARGLEGVVAKRRDGRYEPGQRSGAWLKFKDRKQVPCVIIGYQPNDRGGIRCLLVATDVEGELTYVADVGSGLTGALESKLLRLTNPIVRPAPVIACKMKGIWVEPVLFCTVSFSEWTADLRMRGPVLEKLHDK